MREPVTDPFDRVSVTVADGICLVSVYRSNSAMTGILDAKRVKKSANR